MKKLILVTLFLIQYMFMGAQSTEIVKIWPQGAAENNEVTAPEEITERGILSASKEAQMTIYRPDREKDCGVAVLICPGGGYQILAMKHEGDEFAQLLNERGITAAVLKYRMPNGHYRIPLADAQQGMRILREKAPKWGVKKIGVSGFSAGGHLAASLGVHNDLVTRPDFMILFYPVISTDNDIAHQGSFKNLLGTEEKDTELLTHFSIEKQITKQTPPTLFLLSGDDKAVLPMNSTRMHEQLVRNEVRSSLYIFPIGGHGWGCNESFPYKKDWMKLMFDWMKHEQIIN